MTIRLTTTATNFESAAWQPSGETILQFEVSNSETPVLEIWAKADVDAPYTRVMRWNHPSYPFVRVPQYPYMKLKVTNNTGLALVRCWSNL